MKKIVHLTQSMNRGGAEKLIFDLACRCRQIYDVSIISQYNQIDSYFKSRLEELGVHIYLLNKSPRLDPGNLRDMYRLLSFIKPDIVHTHIQSAVYAVPWYMFHKKSCVKVHTVHSMPSKEFTKTHIAVQKFAYNNLGVIPVACGDAVRREFLQMYDLPENRVKLIYNGIDLAKFSCGEHALTDNFRIVNVANFSEWKNQSMLVDIIQYLDDTYKLELVGEGSCRSKVASKAQSIGVYHRINFTGAVDNVSERLANSDVFVLSSDYEGIPLSVVEAFAAGLPVVATNVGGIPDLVEDGVNGFLVDVNDSRTMANRIVQLRNDRELYKRISANNIAKAQHFDIDETARKYMKIYESGDV